MKYSRAFNFLLITGIALCLACIWVPAYFLTGDGPCHLYNSSILHDIWSGRNASFYSRFYEVVYQPNPNWFSTVVMALLLFVVKGVIAEKLFLTLYVLLFIGGFYLLLLKINRQKSWWLLTIFIFVFTHVLFKGFYNFSFSIAFYFWVVWSWLSFLDKRSFGNALLFILFAGLIFFTHLLAFVFAVFTCVALVISYAIANEEGYAQRRRLALFFTSAAYLVFFIAPFVLLTRWFTEKEGGMRVQLGRHFSRLEDLVRFNYLVNAKQAETYFAMAAGITLLLLLSVSYLRLGKRFKVSKYDGFLLSLLFVSFIYLFFPEEFLGRLILISMRVQLYVFILIVCCISYRLPAGKIKNAGGIILFGCFLGLCIVRIPVLLSTSRAIADISSSLTYIKPYSVVLPLDFSPSGIDEHGKMIADRTWLFCHATQYLGVEKPLIILDNYEANMGYFPLLWQEKVNPYHHLGVGGSFETPAPSADIDAYKNTSGVTVDYILMWCYDSSVLKNDGFRDLYAQVTAGYNKVYTSATSRTILFEKK